MMLRAFAQNLTAFTVDISVKYRRITALPYASIGYLGWASLVKQIAVSLKQCSRD